MGGGQNTYNPLKNKGRNKKIITIIIFLVLIVASISFAIFSPSINLLGRRNIKISKCELDINFKESDELMLVSKYPISKDEALKYNAKDINITNNSTCDTAYYKLTIKDLNNSSINKDKINYQLIDKSDNSETVDKNPDNFLVQDSLTKGNSKTYSIRIWIDESATNTDLFINGDTTKPIEYKYALTIESSDEKPKEMVPVLNIPVGTNGIEKVTHEIDDTLQVDSRFATEYRYRGGDSIVNNYVTFNNETWRIIGVIPTEDIDGNVENRIKIIRNISIGGMYWNDCETNGAGVYCVGDDLKFLNNWTIATLNTYLNNDYYNTLNGDAKSMIGTTRYYLGGYDSSEITSDVMWQYERKKENGDDCSIEDEKYQDGTQCYYFFNNDIMQNDANKKIALMYASDYGYAASKECTSNLNSYSNTNCKTTNNWLDKAQDEWLLGQCSSENSSVLMIDKNAIVGQDIVIFNEYVTRPVLSLSSNVTISSGSGSSSNPYTLSVK